MALGSTTATPSTSPGPRAPSLSRARPPAHRHHALTAVPARAAVRSTSPAGPHDPESSSSPRVSRTAAAKGSLKRGRQGQRGPRKIAGSRDCPLERRPVEDGGEHEQGRDWACSSVLSQPPPCEGLARAETEGSEMDRLGGMKSLGASVPAPSTSTLMPAKAAADEQESIAVAPGTSSAASAGGMTTSSGFRVSMGNELTTVSSPSESFTVSHSPRVTPAAQSSTGSYYTGSSSSSSASSSTNTSAFCSNASSSGSTSFTLPPATSDAACPPPVPLSTISSASSSGITTPSASDTETTASASDAYGSVMSTSPSDLNDLDFDEPRRPLQPPNFAMVTSFVYRGSFPKQDHFPYLRTLGLKSILTLTLDDYPEEHKQFLEEEGITLFHIGMPGYKDPNVKIPPAKIIEALAIALDTRNHPIMIHCNRGKHRTGCLIGCIRKMQGWPTTDILGEYRRFSYPKSRSNDQHFIDGFDTSAAWSSLDDRFVPAWCYRPRPGAAARSPSLSYDPLTGGEEGDEEFDMDDSSSVAGGPGDSMMMEFDDLPVAAPGELLPEDGEDEDEMNQWGTPTTSNNGGIGGLFTRSGASSAGDGLTPIVAGAATSFTEAAKRLQEMTMIPVTTSISTDCDARMHALVAADKLSSSPSTTTSEMPSRIQ